VVQKKRKAVAIWLLVGVGMIIIQVLLGGITRLTESGLSITEWKPVTGALPPLNENAWQTEFDKYKQIGQFQYLHSDFTLDDFKFIFFWEWFHRLWARLLGIVFAIGFIYFLVKKYFDRGMVVPFVFLFLLGTLQGLIGWIMVASGLNEEDLYVNHIKLAMHFIAALVLLFLLGALQGLIGWIMVASGLNEEDLYVNHIKLAMHFIAALVLLCYTLWFALKLIVPSEQRISNKRFSNFTIIIILILGIQLTYGAFMAGLKAAPYVPTWPLLNGMWVPDSFPGKSWVNNHFNVQFLHRQLAYLLATLMIFWFISANRLALREKKSLLARAKNFPFLLVMLQVVLGVFTVLLAPKMGTSRFGSYEIVAEAHQLVAMFLLVSLFICSYSVRRQSA